MTDSTTSYVRSEDVCDIEAERQKKRPCTRSESYSFLASSDSQPNCESSNSQPQPSCTSPAPSYPKETEEDIGDLVNEDSSVVWSCDSPWMPADMDVRSTNAIWATENVFAFCHDRASLDISRDTKGPENTISMAQGPGVASLVGDFNLSGNESNVIPHTDFLIEDATVDNDQVCFGMVRHYYF
ncbi:hypothetical protein BDY21DRAFT_212318 [Lineolata rhizophorae]|uniref:Uncharacterized protein n=1 Tax=Lineolata rhizophorae TaxID=578093 RepID=A0A6A6P496_9PEZI|nr:hypothetical protein BDY21DRAFT_212318 [Lineolata rhizophorae]